jgi:hypothetical protein
MTDQTALKTLAARVSAMRQAMDAVMQGTTPDHAKWSAAESFVRMYCDLAIQYTKLTGDHSIRHYEITKLKGWADSLWPQQKAQFDMIYADALTLASLLSLTEVPAVGPVYNLLVSGLEGAWAGEPFQLELGRCVREYTSPNLTARFGKLDGNAVAEIINVPCIFAYETGLEQPPRFGRIKNITQRQGEVRIEYSIYPIEPFLSHSDLEKMKFDLDISKKAYPAAYGESIG